jgi:hypothetical protein
MLGAALCAVLAGVLCAAPAALASWSRPARLRGCAKALSLAPPLVVFPSAAPTLRSGPGAVLWVGPRGCGAVARVPRDVRDTGGAVGPGGASDRSEAGETVGSAVAFGARLGPEGLPAAGRLLTPAAGDLDGLEIAVGTAVGQVAVAGSAAPTMGALVEGGVAGAFPAAESLGGPAQPVAAFSGYLGDTVVLSTVRATRRAPAHVHARVRKRAPRPSWDLAIRIQRHYSRTMGSPRLLPVGPERPTAVAATMDYRSDVLVVWAAGGEIYARELTAAGVLKPTRRLGGGSPRAGRGDWAPELGALISDDDRAIVAWRSQDAGVTSIAVNISGPDVRFAAPILVERFRDPRGLAPPPGSLRLTRMSSEAVMLAWSGMRAGRYVVRASPVSLRRGVWAPVTVSAPASTEALLAGLAPGPRAEVLALWSVAPRLRDGALDSRRRAIVAAWGHYAGHGEAVFTAPEVVAPPASNGTPAAAFDPQSDRALAAWVTIAGGPRIVYSQRTAGPPPGALVAARNSNGRGGGGALVPAALGLAALGLVLLAAAGAYRAVRPRRGSQASIESSAMRIGTPLAAWRK